MRARARARCPRATPRRRHVAMGVRGGCHGCPLVILGVSPRRTRPRMDTETWLLDPLALLTIANFFRLVTLVALVSTTAHRPRIAMATASVISVRQLMLTLTAMQMKAVLQCKREWRCHVFGYGSFRM